MTLKRDDGRISKGRVAYLCTILGTIAAVILAFQPAVDATKKIVSPWTELPSQIAEIQHLQREHYDEIKTQLDLQTQKLNRLLRANGIAARFETNNEYENFTSKK